MMLLTPRARVVPLLAVAMAAPVSAQQLIGYVNTRDANVTGASDVMDNHFVLTGSVGITAKDHTAPVTLSRGGTVNVCQTSVLHLTESREMTVAAPLLFSLDRGAVEIQMNAAASDAIMTPDLRFTVRNAGPLDLRVRVSRNGDTCVENRGPGAPTLAVSDPFGESMYEVPGGRHVLFEHGSLHEVVDHETTPCGCPDEKGMSVADAVLNAPVAAPVAKPSPAAVPQPTIVAPPLEQLPAAATTARAVTLPPAAPPPVAAKVIPPVQTQAAASPTVVVVQPAAQPVVPAPAPKASAPTPAIAAAAPVPVIVQAPAAQTPPPAATPAPVPVAAAPAGPPVEPPAPTEDSVKQAAAIAAARAAALHPFPAAVSEDLAPVPEPMPAAPALPGDTHAQISDTLSYSAPPTIAAAATPRADTPASASKKPAAESSSATGQPTTSSAQSEPSHDLIHIIGSFFRRLFGRG